MHRGIVPPYLLRRLAAIDDPRYRVASDAAQRSLRHDAPIRELRASTSVPPFLRAEREVHDERPAAAPGTAPQPDRRISDAEHTETLPGRIVRREGQPPVGDAAVDEAYDGLGETFELFARVFSRDSIDGAGRPLEATVHFGEHYDNAFWDGERMVFGDGDGEIFRGFADSRSVVGHELTHGVIDHTAQLRYEGQSGALNEHLADVFGALVEQYAKGQDAEAASWLIGEGVFTDAVEGRALRSMLAPGTAYDDDVLGRDPQPDHMSRYVDTTEDHGGVHLNSGIPNRAFALASRELGGFAWERTGRIWYDVLTSGRLATTAGFDDFAGETVRVAKTLFGDGSAEHLAVANGWTSVGVTPAER
ncbi:M4 family metallopeptidase [Agromyces aerolatus]|uniref:M4 family metallopeptidase n=1 Tax=Agromyces sp. LY-1074 TaxID=3074080 RepID=UPI0028613C97|nr:MULTISPECIES: M4 family metallopeptidase [unclassified Agromyces]MDR5701075.1 M4 family metallopeptidase [Agromyces sp. LY-1074]MDR5707715.1 M4 family metallopeptidase [Agromyces sp. LY-1358]